jgi:sulfur carrier protein
MSISYLLTYLGFNTLLILVDYNGSILQKVEWKQVFLKKGDQIEIITLAGGG